MPIRQPFCPQKSNVVPIPYATQKGAGASAFRYDYVELIADLLATGGEARPTDVARRLGVSHATAIKTITRLKREGLATGLPYRGVFLTDTGQALAERMRTRHRLVVTSLLPSVFPRRGHRASRFRRYAESIRPFCSNVTR
jgi:DtxR family manganese transport transcriptional regulator